MVPAGCWTGRSGLERERERIQGRFFGCCVQTDFDSDTDSDFDSQEFFPVAPLANFHKPLNLSYETPP
jgi:hypothetical protein